MSGDLAGLITVFLWLCVIIIDTVLRMKHRKQIQKIMDEVNEAFDRVDMYERRFKSFLSGGGFR